MEKIVAIPVAILFKSFLDKPISNVKIFRIEPEIFRENMFDIHLKNPQDFYDMPYEHIYFTTDDTLVKAVKIHLYGILRKTSYDRFRANYCVPQDIQVIEKTKSLGQIDRVNDHGIKSAV